MEVEVSAEAKDKRLNARVAITVVVLSVFMGLANVKDGNIVQAMDLAQSNAVDRWNEYQATRIKHHVDEAALGQLKALGVAGSAPAAVEEARLSAEMAKYAREEPGLRTEAQALQGQYDALNVHDDQFDAAEALISIAISLAAVAALTDSALALYVGWAFGAGGMVMGLAAFLGLNLHLEVLSRLLG
jgi:hypothetical protein